jgi:glycosyltransferase involved in cell wall biosynthesis
MEILSQLKVSFLAGTLGQGGAERQLFYIVRALRQNGAVPRLFCLDQNEFWEQPIKDLGVPITWIGRAKSKGGRLLRLLRELRKDRPTVFQSQHFYMNGYVAVTARLLGLSGVGALRSNGRMEARDCGCAGGWLNLRAPRVMAANSQTAMRYAVDQGVPSARLFLLSNVVDTGRFSPAVCPGHQAIRLISAGRLIPSKRFDRFISLVAQLRRQSNAEVNGILVGAGPLSGSLRAQAEALGLPASALELRGSISEMAPVYREADIFVMTSEYEGTPNVLLEAMASGLPVVANNVGGVAELVRHGQDGFLVKPNDEQGLGTALTRLIRDPQLRLAMGRNARARVETHYSLGCLPAMLGRLYGLAVAQRRRGPRPVDREDLSRS